MEFLIFLWFGNQTKASEMRSGSCGVLLATRDTLFTVECFESNSGMPNEKLPGRFGLFSFHVNFKRCFKSPSCPVNELAMLQQVSNLIQILTGITNYQLISYFSCLGLLHKRYLPNLIYI